MQILLFDLIELQSEERCQLHSFPLDQLTGRAGHNRSMYKLSVHDDKVQRLQTITQLH